MTPTIVVSIVLGALLFLVILLICAVEAAKKVRQKPSERHRIPKGKGEMGETYVARILQRCCQNEYDHLMNNVILYDPHRKSSCEIDHIFIGPHGVFVIETKNRAGKIFGDDEHDEWTQVLADGSLIHTMRSPVLQNETHVRFLEQILYRRVSESIPVTGLVVFVRGNTQNIQSSSVCTPFQLSQRLEQDGHHITPAEQERAYRTLRAHLERYPITKEQHLQYIRSRHPNEQD